MKLSVRWCVCGRSGKNFPIGYYPRHQKLCNPLWRSTSMDSTATARPCVCILSSVCGMAFMCGSTLVKVPLQAPSWYDLRCLKATSNPNKQTGLWKRPHRANYMHNCHERNDVYKHTKRLAYSPDLNSVKDAWAICYEESLQKWCHNQHQEKNC